MSLITLITQSMNGMQVDQKNERHDRADRLSTVAFVTPGVGLAVPLPSAPGSSREMIDDEPCHQNLHWEALNHSSSTTRGLSTEPSTTLADYD
jgi:hypothetical protein